MAVDGLIFDIVFPKGVENPFLKEVAPVDKRAPLLPSGVRRIASWGSYPNQLFYDKNDNTISGKDRATTFKDKEGQASIKLSKGAVATKLSYDNCKVEIPVYVSTVGKNGKGQTYRMYKHDAGGMPNAVIDIWKTGVEKWGYTYKELFSMPKMVSFYHANLNINGNKYYK